MVTRALNGLAAGSVIAVGAAAICDLYFTHQRGLYMGIYTLCLTNGPHVRIAPTTLMSWIWIDISLTFRLRRLLEDLQPTHSAGGHAFIFQAISN